MRPIILFVLLLAAAFQQLVSRYASRRQRLVRPARVEAEAEAEAKAQAALAAAAAAGGAEAGLALD